MRRRRSRWRIFLEDAKTEKGVDWSYFFKRYLWDDAVTPYFFPVSKLDRGQAASELLAYTLFIGLLFFFTAFFTTTGRAPGGASPAMSLYSFTVACAAVTLGMTRHPWPAVWCAASPAVLLLYFGVVGFPTKLGGIDQFIVITVLLLVMWYGRRVVRIARAYPQMPDPPDPPDRA